MTVLGHLSLYQDIKESSIFFIRFQFKIVFVPGFTLSDGLRSPVRIHTRRCMDRRSFKDICLESRILPLVVRN